MQLCKMGEYLSYNDINKYVIILNIIVVLLVL